MKMKNKVALALTLALGSMAAHAQDKGMDISISATPRTPAAPVAAPTMNPAPAQKPAAPVAQSGGAGNLEAIAPAKPAANPAISLPAQAAKPKVAATAPARVEPQKRVEPAQPVQPAQPVRPADPVVTAAPKAPVSTPAVPAAPANDVGGETNPFTGKNLAIEQRQGEIERAKLDTDLMIERLKQANLMADLTYLPLKKKAEVTAMPGVLAAANSSPKQATAAEPSANPAPRKAVKKSGKKAAPKAPTVETPVAKPPEPPRVSVTGITINGKKASAILEVEGGGVFSAEDGDTTPYGKLRVADTHTVYVGERRIQVRDATLSRMYISDPAVVDERIKNNTVITAPPAAQSSANIPLPPLPPLPRAVVPKGPAPMPATSPTK
jgi:hypothetical protein